MPKRLIRGARSLVGTRGSLRHGCSLGNACYTLHSEVLPRKIESEWASGSDLLWFLTPLTCYLTLAEVCIKFTTAVINDVGTISLIGCWPIFFSQLHRVKSHISYFIYLQHLFALIFNKVFRPLGGLNPTGSLLLIYELLPTATHFTYSLS